MLALRTLSPDVQLGVGLGAATVGAVAAALAFRMRTAGPTPEFGDQRCPRSAYMTHLGERYGEAVAHRAWYFAPAIHEAADYFGIPRSLLMALVHTESRFQPTAGSSAGAIGLAQLMPKTAVGRYRSLAKDNRWPFGQVADNRDPQRAYLAEEGLAQVLDRTDPRQSAWLGASFIHSLMAGGRDVEYSLAAYNAGPGRVKYGDPKGTWPSETQRYVPAIMSRVTPYRRLYEACGTRI